jgi:hypothetical protein
MNTGIPAPIWRIPCLSNGGLLNLPLTAFHEKPMVLCCMPSLTETKAWLLEAQVPCFHKNGVVLAALVYDDPLFHQSWIRPPHEFHLLLFTDPLRRLARKLRLSRSLPPYLCETLFFDQERRYRFRLLHDLNLRGITTVREIGKNHGCQKSKSGSFESQFQSTRFHAQRPEIEAPTGSNIMRKSC